MSIDSYILTKYFPILSKAYFKINKNSLFEKINYQFKNEFYIIVCFQILITNLLIKKLQLNIFLDVYEFPPLRLVTLTGIFEWLNKFQKLDFEYHGKIFVKLIFIFHLTVIVFFNFKLFILDKVGKVFA